MVSENAKKSFDRGLSHFHKGEHDKAVELFKKALMEDPDYPEALYNLASCFAALDQSEDAILYLDRAAKLNIQCLDWAREDSEFESLRKDSSFQQILRANDPMFSKPPPGWKGQSVEEFEESISGPDMTKASEGMPNLNDGRKVKKPEEPESELPPCPGCGGIVTSEKVPVFPMGFSGGLVFVGMIVSLVFFSWLTVLIGIPMMCLGFFLFMQSKEEWVCQNCGARGLDAGQPPPAAADKEKSVV